MDMEKQLINIGRGILKNIVKNVIKDIYKNFNKKVDIKKGISIAEEFLGKQIGHDKNIKLYDELLEDIQIQIINQIFVPIKNLGKKNANVGNIIDKNINIFNEAYIKLAELSSNSKIKLAKSSMPFFSIQSSIRAFTGMNYCGPTTRVIDSLANNVKPHNAIDFFCRIHDIDYLSLGLIGSSLTEEQFFNEIQRMDLKLINSGLELLKTNKLSKDDKKLTEIVVNAMSAKIKLWPILSNAGTLGRALQNIIITPVKITKKTLQENNEKFVVMFILLKFQDTLYMLYMLIFII